MYYFEFVKNKKKILLKAYLNQLFLFFKKKLTKANKSSSIDILIKKRRISIATYIRGISLGGEIKWKGSY